MNLVRFHYGENNINTGPLKEIPEICVDHFFGDDLNSSIFFLSHAHTDHLVGLETTEFVRRLRQPGVKLYCHPLTPILLGSFKRYLGGPEGIRELIKDKKIVPLDVKQPQLLKITRPSGSLNVTVTLLSAGHCPGSVMFLFETSKYRILHTGDFRLEVEDLKRMPHLHDDDNAPKRIDHLYVDTTFCSKSANFFPNRISVLNEAIEHIREWIGMSKEHVIDLRFSAKFAHEYVLLELYRLFKQKIHVTPERRDIYENIPELYEIVTLDNRSQFHLCGNRGCFEDGHPISIKFSSMWFTKGKKEDKGHIAWYGKNMNICYSMHSSLKEIAKTIDYLKPRIVTPLVLPKNSKLPEVEEALRSATSTPFEFKDYRSSRNIFGEATPTETLCAEERDDTYMDIDGTDKEKGAKEEDNPDSLDSSMELDIPVELSPPKRARLDQSKNVWQYTFSPSPKSKSSQGSSEDACSSQSTNGGSQEDLTVSESLGKDVSVNPIGTLDGIEEDHFLLPLPFLPVKVNPRRNLAKTIFSEGSSAEENSYECDSMDKDNESCEIVNSQRF